MATRLLQLAIFSSFIHLVFNSPDGLYLGCYFDSATPRALPDLNECTDEACDNPTCDQFSSYCQDSDGMTIQRCLDLCAKRELRYAGLEAGNQCFCGAEGTDYDRHGVGQGNCEFPCTGDALEDCGGTFRLQIYEIGCEPLVPGNNTLVTLSNTDFNYIGTTATFSCEENYQLSGDQIFTCLSNGEWDKPPVVPSCELNTCGSPTLPANSATVEDLQNVSEFDIDETIEIVCQYDDTLVYELTCEATRDWNIPVTSCPEPPQGATTSSSALPPPSSSPSSSSSSTTSSSSQTTPENVGSLTDTVVPTSTGADVLTTSNSKSTTSIPTTIIPTLTTKTSGDGQVVTSTDCPDMLVYIIVICGLLVFILVVIIAVVVGYKRTNKRTVESTQPLAAAVAFENGDEGVDNKGFTHAAELPVPQPVPPPPKPPPKPTRSKISLPSAIARLARTAPSETNTLSSNRLISATSANSYVEIYNHHDSIPHSPQACSSRHISTGDVTSNGNAPNGGTTKGNVRNGSIISNGHAHHHDVDELADNPRSSRDRSPSHHDHEHRYRSIFDEKQNYSKPQDHKLLKQNVSTTRL